MRGTLKTSTLESKFPLLRVENNCIISKFADITAAYRVSLPELFTLTGEEYEALHGAWLKALKVLPDYTVVHKQDFFIEERYTAPEEGSERSFLARSGRLRLLRRNVHERRPAGPVHPLRPHGRPCRHGRHLLPEPPFRPPRASKTHGLAPASAAYRSSPGRRTAVAFSSNRKTISLCAEH